MPVPAIDSRPSGRIAGRQIKVLLLDDSRFDRARIRRLSDKMDLMVDLDEVGDMEGLNQAISGEVYDLVLIDYRLPQGDGLDVLEQVQNSALNCDTATVMITGNGDMEVAVAAMRNGCHDFLAKDAMTTEQLRSAMVRAMASAAEHCGLLARTRQQREVISHGLKEALTDPEVQKGVVGLFQQELEQVIAHHSYPDVGQDSSALDALLAGLRDNDEFTFS